MVSDQAGTDQRVPVSLGSELRGDALDVLCDALEWWRTHDRWDVVGQAVHAIVEALRSGNAAAFREAVYDLELAGLVRAIGIGDTPVVPPPNPVLKEINELIHTVDNRA